ncbi:MAG: cell envelope integrity protein CreD [Acidobacteria bacterium]|nr:cell envelope integrity protein CreD [Acidobacteriota bacterium]MCI0717473.1 cell envelope integrity protein CreD [Acidobacteriota bacterium]
MIKRLIAIVFIYVCTVVAWMILGSTVMFRTDSQDQKMKGAVSQLWGTVQTQQAPSVYYCTRHEYENKRIEGGKTIKEIEVKTTTHPVALSSSIIDVDLLLEHRRKGLLWYSTYTVLFAARYTIENETSEAREFFINFQFPAEGAVYDDFRFSINGTPRDNLQLTSGKLNQPVSLKPGENARVEVRYKSQGLDQWWYDFGSHVRQVKDFVLTMKTDFTEIDFPPNSISPAERIAQNRGWQLKWKYANLLSGAKIGMELPHKLNPGPWVSQVTFSAPVSLFLFFFLLFIFTTRRDIRVHPMNYFFLGTGFFSFHLLLAYLVDHVSIHAAFLISSAVSIALVVSYMRLVVGTRFAFVEIAMSQFVYLVLFSYTFFFEGYTGLAITILCVLTLFMVMQFTGRLDWEELFRKKPNPRAA